VEKTQLKFLLKMSNDKFTVICGGAELPRHVEGIEVACTDCEASCFLSYATMDHMVDLNPEMTVDKVRVLCLSCGVKFMEDDKLRVKKVSEEERQEIINKNNKKS
jgi:hypothetical protein